MMPHKDLSEWLAGGKRQGMRVQLHPCGGGRASRSGWPCSPGREEVKQVGGEMVEAAGVLLLMLVLLVVMLLTL